MPDADRFVPLDPDMGDPIVIDTTTGRMADPEAVRLHEMERECQRLTQQARALEAATTPTSIPGPDPLDTATQWLNLHQKCDLDCKQNHPVNHSTVTGLHAAAATARIAGAEYKRERNELQVLLVHAVLQLQSLADRSPVPPAGALLALATELEEGL